MQPMQAYDEVCKEQHWGDVDAADVGFSAGAGFTGLLLDGSLNQIQRPAGRDAEADGEFQETEEEKNYWNSIPPPPPPPPPTGCRSPSAGRRALALLPPPPLRASEVLTWVKEKKPSVRIAWMIKEVDWKPNQDLLQLLPHHVTFGL
uniref:Uncharacterized protein n=1 Tax=Oryza meridionalis TaxID=40149 RepID=A0A0E0C251_9ORYZ